MHYICPSNSKSTVQTLPLPMGRAEPLALAPGIATYRVGDERLVISSKTGGWCYLTAKEWEVAQSFDGRSIYEIAQSVNFSEIEIVRFATSLMGRGLLVSAHAITTEKKDWKQVFQGRPSRYILTFILSNRCNLACEYCYHSIQTCNGKGIIPYNLANLALQYAFNQPADELMIDFGEIVVSEPVFYQLLHTARQLQEKTSKQTIYAIQTNGTTLTRKKAIFLKQKDVFVGLSIDGTAKLHDQMRKYPTGLGSYAKARAGLENLIELDVPFIVSTTIHRMNFQHLREILNHFNEINIAQFIFKPILNRGNASSSWKEIGLTSSEYHSFLDEMVVQAMEHRHLDWLDTTFITLLQRALGDIRGWSSSCYSGFCQGSKTQLVVNANGFCYPCPRYSSIGKGDFCLGLLDGLALNTVNPITMPEWGGRNTSFQPQKCLDCSWYAFCGGGCPLEDETSDDDCKMCSITSKIYELIFNNIFPKLCSETFIRSNKIGNISVIHEEYFRLDQNVENR